MGRTRHPGPDARGIGALGVDAGAPLVPDGIVSKRLDTVSEVAGGHNEAGVGNVFVPVPSKNARGGVAFGVEGSTRLVDNKGVVVTGENAIGLIAFGFDDPAIGDGVLVSDPNAIAFGVDAAAVGVGDGVVIYGPNAYVCTDVDVAVVGDCVVVCGANASASKGSISTGADAAVIGDGITVNDPNAIGTSYAIGTSSCRGDGTAVGDVAVVSDPNARPRRGHLHRQAEDGKGPEQLFRWDNGTAAGDDNSVSVRGGVGDVPAATASDHGHIKGPTFDSSLERIKVPVL